MSFAQTRTFFRTGVNEEEITPPCVKTRSFDSLSVAHILQAKLDTTALPEEQSVSSPSSPGSPSINAVAAMLTSVHAHAGMDNAADCLLSLATMSTSHANGNASTSSSRHGAGARTSKRNGVSDARATANADSLAARRRLKLINKPTGREGVRAGPKTPAKSPTMGPMTPGQALTAHKQQSAATSARQHRQRQAHLAKARGMMPPPAARAQSPSFTVSGAAYPIHLQSGADLKQLKMLAAAFQLCPSPTPDQLAAVAARVNLTPDRVATWFSARRTLNDWVVRQSKLEAPDLVSMFYKPVEEIRTTSACSVGGSSSSGSSS